MVIFAFLACLQEGISYEIVMFVHMKWYEIDVFLTSNILPGMGKSMVITWQCTPNTFVFVINESIHSSFHTYGAENPMLNICWQKVQLIYNASSLISISLKVNMPW